MSKVASRSEELEGPNFEGHFPFPSIGASRDLSVEDFSPCVATALLLVWGILLEWKVWLPVSPLRS